MSTSEVIHGSMDAGFVPRQTADIQQELNEGHYEIVDPSTGQLPFQNNSDDTILQQVNAIVAEAQAEAENAAAWWGLSRDIQSATGVGLSALAQIMGLLRKPGEYTIIPLTITDDPGTFIEAGFSVAGANGGIAYATRDDVVVPDSGAVTVSAWASEYGVYNPDPGTVVVVQTPVTGRTSVTNGVTSSIGTDEETDAQLRLRLLQSTNATSYRQIESIRVAVLNIPGVTFCRAYQNSELDTDERGIPGKTLALVAVGGEDNEIANQIFLRVPLGIRYQGTTTVVIYDNQYIAYPVSFSRPIERDVYVDVALRVVSDEGIEILPDDAIARIKAAIIQFAQYGHNSCEPIGNPGFPPGQDIIPSQLYTPINSVGGSEIVSVQVGFSAGSLSPNRLVVAWNEWGAISEDRINVRFVN